MLQGPDRYPRGKTGTMMLSVVVDTGDDPHFVKPNVIAEVRITV